MNEEQIRDAIQELENLELSENQLKLIGFLWNHVKELKEELN